VTDQTTALTDRFKTAFRQHPAGVALIAASTSEGPVGLTASSVASVSADPPALSFSVTRATGSAGGILGADTFTVHLLSEQNAPIAAVFSRSGSERFTPEQGWTTLPTGEPYLPAAPAALRCRALTTVPIGASSLVLAEVLDVVVDNHDTPLIYVDRAFRALAADPLEV